MVRTTPFHPRLAELSDSQLWQHWSGYLSAVRYDLSAKQEYMVLRNAAGFFDTSPLFKYWVRGRDAERFLGGVMARDVRTCRPGRAQYTVWCDDDGFVLEDGVLLRHSADEFLLSAAQPNAGYLRSLVGHLDVEIVDVSTEFASLAVQGPRSRTILAQLMPEVTSLGYFALAPAKVAGIPVVVSRTGFTGDLGFELWVPAESALTVLDAVIEVGEPYGLRPFGNDALNMARIEAGLPLLGVEFSSARFSYTEHERFTPQELGLGWLLRTIDDDSRPFIGRAALRREAAEGTSRWATVGLVIDWRAYYDLYAGEGLIPRYDELPAPWETMLYDDDGERAGYATSLMYSPVLQRYIAMARVRPELSGLGTVVHVEQSVNHRYVTVPAAVSPMPFFNPERKVASA
jgi:aminomethyltransferase